MGLTPEQAIDSINQAYGRHAGRRALHAKGILCTGTFTATPEAARFSRAAHMQGNVTAATFRFSNGSGDPDAPDWAPDTRGCAVKLYLADGSRTDIVAISSPRFPTGTPEGFIELVEAQGAGRAGAWKLPIFFARHPEAIRVLPVIAPTLLAPPSYAVIAYYGIHAFTWLNDEGVERHVRYTLRPLAAAPRLAPWQAKRRGSDYLQQEIADRLERGPVRFTLELQIASPGDPIDDPNAGWPRDRRRVDAGSFEITGLETERETGGDVLVFDPARVTDGVALTPDPVLQFRPRAYSESVARRTGG